MSELQDLLNQEAVAKGEERERLHTAIRLARDEKYCPSCFGYDDCSTDLLIRCPWRIDCGS